MSKELEVKEYISDDIAIFVNEETRSRAELSLVDDFLPEIPGRAFFFNRLIAGIPGKGGGTAVLKKALEHSDKTDTPIINQVNAYGNLSQTQLVAYYKKHGFSRIAAKYGDDGLVYWPNKSKLQNEDMQKYNALFEQEVEEPEIEEDDQDFLIYHRLLDKGMQSVRHLMSLNRRYPNPDIAIEVLTYCISKVVSDLIDTHPEWREQLEDEFPW